MCRRRSFINHTRIGKAFNEMGPKRSNFAIGTGVWGVERIGEANGEGLAKYWYANYKLTLDMHVRILITFGLRIFP